MFGPFIDILDVIKEEITFIMMKIIYYTVTFNSARHVKKNTTDSRKILLAIFFIEGSHS